MIRRSIVGVLAAAGGLLCAGSVMGQDAGGPAAGQPGEPVEIAASELPSAGELFEGYIEAVGGREAWLAIETRRFAGRIKVYVQGREEPTQVGRIEMLAAAPGTLIQDMIFPGQSSVRTIVKGGVVWQVNEQDEATQITGQTASRQVTSARFYQLAEWEEMFSATEVVGGVEQGDRRAARVRATHVDGRTEVYVFDLDSGLLLAVLGQRPSPADPSQIVPFRRVYEDYQATDGVLYSRRVLEQAGPIAFEIEVTEIEVGVEVPEIEVPDFASEADGGE